MAAPADRALELVALRQVRRRNFNERLLALGGEDSGDAIRFRCECGLIACGAAIQLTASEYAEVRAGARHFAVLAAHVIPEAQRVVATRRGWALVELPPGHTGDIAVRADASARAVRLSH